MNKLILSLVIILLTISPAFAYDGNPDRYPSFGLNLQFGAGTGTYTATDATGVSASQNLTSSFGTLVFDSRIPTSDWTTLYFGLSLSGNEVKGDATPIFFSNDDKINSYAFNVGVRYYIH